MQIFGFNMTSEHIDEPVKHNDVSEPFFVKGDKTGFIVLHGIGGTPANVRVTADALAASGHTVYAPMLAGHGKTVRHFGKTPGKEWLATALAAYDRLKEEGCTRIIPVGLSLGGILTGEIAARRECAGAVLISAPVKMKSFLRIAEFISPFFPYIKYNGGEAADPAQKYAVMLNGLCTRRLFDLDILIHDLRRRLKDVRCPVFAIWAGLDNKVHDDAKVILRAKLDPSVPYTETTIPNSPHGSTYANERDTVARLVKEFTDALPGVKED